MQIITGIWEYTMNQFPENQTPPSTSDTPFEGLVDVEINEVVDYEGGD